MQTQISDNRNVHESQPLLVDHAPPAGRLGEMSSGRWKAHPYWLIPVVMVASMSRGITMAPRIQVYTDIACRALLAPPANTDPGFSLNLLEDCSSSQVQARAAAIQATVTTTMSILSAVSTGPWSRFGDEHGRKPILCLTLGGAFMLDFVFLLVKNPDSLLGRHAERFILLGPIFDGFAGGLSAFNGVVHAYTSDCTAHGSRSKIFSTLQGLVAVGLALGPWVGGVVLPTGYHDATHLFYLSISLLAFTFCFVWFLCPESRVPQLSDNVGQSRDGLRFKTSPGLVIGRYTRRAYLALLSPIAMFAPRKMPGTAKKNYNLTILGVSLFVYLISTGIYQSKYLYAKHVYSWSTAELGHYMSLLWITRAFNLLVFLPIVISYLKPKKVHPNDTSSPEHIAAELKFDKRLAQCSLAVDGFADTMVAITPTTSQVSFSAFSCLSSFTSGGNPALHSLGAVCLHAYGYGSEVGALFGAMAVLSAIAHIISPFVYALTYGVTVGSFPQAIFTLSSAMLFSVVLMLTMIRPSDGATEMRRYSRLQEEEA
ncbi:major facilitator superfamily domain-containing protein [Infundibulicybe gibba]|nr:major facilitator superfamily domain-containing protein [Infundibulicybe gibba]